MVETAQALARAALVTGTSGNVSVRLPNDRVLITPSGIDYDRLRPSEVAVVALDGTVVSAKRAPSSEVPLHLDIYRVTDARAIVHTHSPSATAVGLVSDELPSVHYAIRRLGGPIRVAPYAVFGSAALAQQVTHAMRGRRATLMRNHGAVAIGGDLTDALTNAVTLEWLSELYLRARAVGLPATLSEEELSEVARAAATAGYRY
ncbi:class II aldolase/adducin family protein [Nocardioides sp. KR10-350]|uniref:class II aldolase/adducin family protein n=1 Tax=Nocardioides cheoyonin TaxID=3156615 RepID=UPI0032B414C5